MVQDPGTRDDRLIQHTRCHLQEIHDPGFGSRGLLDLPFRRFLWGGVANGCGEEDLGNGGYGGGDERCKEREEKDWRGKRGEGWEYESFCEVLDFVWAERLPQRPGGDTDPGDQQLYGVRVLVQPRTTSVPTYKCWLNSGNSQLPLDPQVMHDLLFATTTLGKQRSPRGIPLGRTMIEKSSRSISRSSMKGVLRRSLSVVVERQVGESREEALVAFRNPHRGSSIGGWVIPSRGRTELSGCG